MKYRLTPKPIEEHWPEPDTSMVAAQGECPQCKAVNDHMIYEPWDGSLGVYISCPVAGCGYRWMADVKAES